MIFAAIVILFSVFQNNDSSFRLHASINSKRLKIPAEGVIFDQQNACMIRKLLGFV